MSETELQLIIKGYGGKPNLIRIEKESTIQELYDKVAEHLSFPGELHLVHAGKELRATNPYGKIMRLDDYGIEDESNLLMTLRLSGGSLSKIYGPDVKQTHELDCVIQAETDEPRTKLPCGHPIGPSTMTMHIFQKIEEKRHSISCPMELNQRCKEEINFKTVKKVAALSKQERIEVEGGLSMNYLLYHLRIKECPGCKSFCTRKDVNNPRVRCSNCSMQKKQPFEFCWNCLKTWKGGSDCGNTGCHDSSLSVLAECRSKIINEVECPDTRACPSCGTLISHTIACKHMQCPYCKKYFCFVCLAIKDETGQFTCGAHNTKCNAAPRQTVLPN